MNNNYALKWMALEITSKCNMNCIHCRSSSTENSYEGIYTIDKVKKLFDDIAAFASPVIVLSGGEPLLNKNIFEISSIGTNHGFRMAMATNGSIVDDTICQEIKKSGIKIVSLSLDGPSSSVHDDFRVQDGSFESVIKATEYFKKHNIKFIINSSFTKRNQDYIKETYELSKKLGAHAWYMFMIVPTGRGEDVMSELITSSDYEKILNWHYDMERKEDSILVRPTCAPHYYRIWHEKSKEEGESTERRSLTFSTGGGKGCVAAQSILFISSTGDVYPCSYFPVSSGNILESNIEDIWNNSKVFNDIRAFHKYEGKCGSCKYINVCGGCRARAYAVNGSYMSEEPFCNYIPSKLRV